MSEIEQVSQREILDTVRRRFGIALCEVETGGGCMALEARLESGHWIVATDENLRSFRSRLLWEAENDAPAGWSVGIYPHSAVPDMGWFGVDSVVDVIDYDASGPALVDVIGRALAELLDGKRR
jgi:hypothetical protein